MSFDTRSFPERDNYDPQQHFLRYQADGFTFDDGDGVRYTSPNGNSVYIHRLAAVAWFGFEAVKDNRVYHKNRIRWDTREDNLSVGKDVARRNSDT